MGNLQSLAQKKYQIALGTLGVGFIATYLQLKNDNRKLQEIIRSIDPWQLIKHNKYLGKVQNIDQKFIVKQLIAIKNYPIYRVALTGGPCGGKSTALQSIRKHFTQAGFSVLVVPELPTLVSQGGGMSDFHKYGSKDRIKFQMDLLKFKIYFEDYIAKLAQMNKQPTIILCDRGLVDCAAYMPHQQFQALLDQMGMTWPSLRDKRYDSVIFMNTAAIGAEQFYTLANNAARTQTPEQARQLDRKTLHAWIGHPYMTVCPNIKGKPFSYKVDLTIKAVRKTIGLQSTEVINHKLLVQFDQIPQDVITVRSEIQQIYLINQNQRYVQDKIKKRGQDNSYTYMRKFVGPYIKEQAFREVVRIPINSLQYVTLQHEKADPKFKPIRTKRINFEWKSHYFSLDQHENLPGIFLLRFELTKGLQYEQLIPPWIKFIRDIREQNKFMLSQISLKEQ